jgi:hypothetical protein
MGYRPSQRTSSLVKLVGNASAQFLCPVPGGSIGNLPDSESGPFGSCTASKVEYNGIEHREQPARSRRLTNRLGESTVVSTASEWMLSDVVA